MSDRFTRKRLDVCHEVNGGMVLILKLMGKAGMFTVLHGRSARSAVRATRKKAGAGKSWQAEQRSCSIQRRNPNHGALKLNAACQHTSV